MNICVSLDTKQIVVHASIEGAVCQLRHRQGEHSAFEIRSALRILKVSSTKFEI